MRTLAHRLPFVPCLLLALGGAGGSGRALAAPAPPATAAGPAAHVLAHGTQQRLWVARVLADPQDPGSQRTFIHARDAGDDQWQLVARVPARVVQMAHQGGELAVLLDGGDWRLLWQEGSSIGPALPGQGRLLAIAAGAGSPGGNERLWGVGLVPGGMASLSTRPATQPQRGKASATSSTARTSPALAVPTTVPAEAAVPVTTAPAPTSVPAAAPVPKLVLLLSIDGRWVPQADLPVQAAPAEVATIPMAAAAGDVAMAFRRSGQAVQVWRYSPQDGWTSTTVRSAPAQPREDRVLPAARDASDSGAKGEFASFDLVSDDGRALFLWTADRSGGGILYPLFTGAEPTTPIPLAPLVLPAGLPPISDRAVVMAGGRIRLLLLLADGQLMEQTYDLRGAAQGPPVQVMAAQPAVPDAAVSYWVNLSMGAALVLVLLSSLRRREAMQRTLRRVEQLRLAPLGRRALAGAVDLMLPVLLAMGIRAALAPKAMGVLGDLSTFSPDSTTLWYLLAGYAAFIAHTMVGELLAGGRSLGKWMLGLQVTNLEGQRASAGEIVLRNLLRVIDVATLFTSLLFVPLSPLRQRIGDIAAGTLVVGPGGSGLEPPAGDDAPGEQQEAGQNDDQQD